MVRGLPEVKAPPIGTLSFSQGASCSFPPWGYFACPPVVPPSHYTVLVGNKADLEDKREVSHQEGKDLAHQWNCPFFETSAKLKTNIEETFFCLVRKIREAEGLPQNKYGDKPSKSCLLF